jgi:hypothetical protein
MKSILISTACESGTKWGKTHEMPSIVCGEPS